MAMEVLAVIEALNALMKVATAAGVNIQKLQAMRAEAAARGEELSIDDLKALADDAQAAINKL
jgi:ligand-binding sensor domain-containing protein